jgi:hypothetical protein
MCTDNGEQFRMVLYGVGCKAGFRGWDRALLSFLSYVGPAAEVRAVKFSSHISIAVSVT